MASGSAAQHCWLQGHEGVKMSQCDLVMVGTGVHVDGCVQFNMANCHVNACSCVMLRNTVQSNINGSLLYKVKSPRVPFKEKQLNLHIRSCGVTG